VNATGICDLVENNLTGFLVNENPDEFSGAVEKIIQDKNLRHKMGKEGARIAREKYTDEFCADKLLEVYKKAIEKKNNTIF
jgi:glycosyltransferase involved in cell wall biosynthesis